MTDKPRMVMLRIAGTREEFLAKLIQLHREAGFLPAAPQQSDDTDAKGDTDK
jgi:hypothetical protein